MGLRDAFGVGGGSLGFELHDPCASPGGVIVGNVTFVAGRRPQTIVAIQLQLECLERRATTLSSTTEPASMRDRALVIEYAISDAFTSSPGRTTTHPFALPVPSDAPPSAWPQRVYRLIASAEVSGEIDPIASVEVAVLPSDGRSTTSAVAREQLPIGTRVVGEWHDGRWHPGRVVAVQNGYVGIDWDDPRLGASSWLERERIRLR